MANNKFEKYRNKAVKTLSTLLVFSLCVNILGVHALADTGIGTAEDPAYTETILIEVFKDADGNTVTTTTTTENWEGTTTTESEFIPENTDPKKDDYTGTTTAETTVTGQETTTETNTDLPDGRPLVKEGEITGEESTTSTTTIEESWTEDRPEESSTTTETGATAIVTDTTGGQPEEIDLSDSLANGWTEGEEIVVSENAIPDVTVDLTPAVDKDQDGKADQDEWVKAEGDTDESKLIDQITPSADIETVSEGANGEIIRTVTTSEPIVENGKTIGYTTVTTVTTTFPSETGSVSVPYTDGVTEAQKAETDTTIEQGTYSQPGTYNETGSYSETNSEPFRSESITLNLPEKPTESTTATAEGGKVTVTVLEIVDESLDLDNDGNPDVVGYTTATVTTDKDGNILSQEENSVWATKTTVTTEVSPTTDIDVTKELITTTTTTLITQGVTGTGRKIVATDREVYGWMSHVEENANHGEINLEPSQITHTTDNADLKASAYSSPYYENSDLKFVAPDGEEFKYVNYGLASEFKINGSEVHFFELVDETGNKYYAYCVDHSTSAYGYTLYNADNLSDVSYFGGASNNSDSTKVEAARTQLRAIAENGYWGNENSLANAQALVDKVYGEGVYTLTPGQAMSATQAAIWYIGFSGQNSPVTETSANSNATGDDKAAIDALYKALIGSQNVASHAESDFIDAEDITDASITVKEKLSETKDGNDVYNTDVSFGLGVEESSINGDLIVTVYDSNGNALRKIRVAGDDEKDKNDNLFTKNFTKNGTDYTLHDLQLAENVTITLNLSGTQNLEKGVYVFTATTGAASSQSFITNAVGPDGNGGSYQVDLSVDLAFKVNEPEANIWETGAEEENSFTRKYVEERIDTTTRKTVTAEISVSTLIEDMELREWSHSWIEKFSYESDEPDTPKTPKTPKTPDTPGTPDPTSGSGEVIDDPEVPLTDLPEEEVPLTELPEEEVPLADVPKTGTTVAISGAMSVFSALGLAALQLLDRRKRK